MSIIRPVWFFNDPPPHTRVRKLIAGALTPLAISELELALTALVDNVLDRMDEKSMSI